RRARSFAPRALPARIESAREMQRSSVTCMQVEDPEISRIVKDTHLWEFLITLASLLLVGVLTLVVARRLARWLSGKTRFGLRGLHRLAAPMTALVIGLVALLAINLTVREPPIIGELLVELV